MRQHKVELNFYKRCPAWLATAMVEGEDVTCRVINEGESQEKETNICGFSHGKFIAADGTKYDIAFPITEWIPELGEQVAFWEDDSLYVCTGIYECTDYRNHCFNVICEGQKMNTSNIAEIDSFAKYNLTQKISSWKDRVKREYFFDKKLCRYNPNT